MLRLIAQGLSNREISERLFLALNTVKGHNQKIFSKLQVQSRTEAIARARELGLLVTKASVRPAMLAAWTVCCRLRFNALAHIPTRINSTKQYPQQHLSSLSINTTNR